jgi:formylglycine-generating enzyme required for sulfatase activity
MTCSNDPGEWGDAALEIDFSYKSIPVEDRKNYVYEVIIDGPTKKKVQAKYGESIQEKVDIGEYMIYVTAFIDSFIGQMGATGDMDIKVKAGRNNVRVQLNPYDNSQTKSDIRIGTTINSTNYMMKWIPGGSFTMGSPVDEPGRSTIETPHIAIVSGFYMCEYQITQEQYQEVMSVNPSYFTTANSRPPDSGETDAKRPVEQVTWFDAVEFCNKQSIIDGLDPVYTISGRTPTSGYPITSATVEADFNANGYRLPTEAEWEYACRAETITAYHTGNTISDNTGWYNVNSNSKTHEVGKKTANAWGLKDMHGNVWEWCWDWYGAYPGDGLIDYKGLASGTNRVIRGGSWSSSAQYVRSASRNNGYQHISSNTVGFRVVRR